MRRILASILGLLIGANGLWMVVAPFHWYAAIPGVAGTGSANLHFANLHFIRDIGCAYLVTALALLWFAAAPEQARPAVLFGGIFLLLHAFVHFWDTAAGRESPHRLMAEIPTVILPAFLVLWLGWPPRSASRKEL